MDGVAQFFDGRLPPLHGGGITDDIGKRGHNWSRLRNPGLRPLFYGFDFFLI